MGPFFKWNVHVPLNYSSTQWQRSFLWCSLTHQSWINISGWNSSSSSSHSPSFFRSTTCSMVNQLRTTEKVPVTFTMHSYCIYYSRSWNWKISGRRCFSGNLCYNQMYPVTLTCTEAFDRPQHLLGCHCSLLGGLLCWLSIQWSPLWIKRKALADQTFNKASFLPFCWCIAVSHLQVQNVEAHVRVLQASQAQVEGCLYLTLYRTKDNKGQLFKKKSTTPAVILLSITQSQE